MVLLLWGGVSIVTRGDSCDGNAPPHTVVATADPDKPLDQLDGVVVVVTLVDEAGNPVVGAEANLSWSPDSDRIAGTTSSGVSDSNGQITYQGFGDADYGTWNLTVTGNYTQSIPRMRKSGNPNRYTHVVKVVPSPSPTPSPTPTPSPSPSPSPSPTLSASPVPTATAPIFFHGGGGGGGTVATPTPVPGSGSVSAEVIITPNSPGAAYPNATFLATP
jgi:hypothetical protein